MLIYYKFDCSKLYNKSIPLIPSKKNIKRPLSIKKKNKKIKPLEKPI